MPLLVVEPASLFDVYRYQSTCYGSYHGDKFGKFAENNG